MFHKRSTKRAKEGFRGGSEYCVLERTEEAQEAAKPVSSPVKLGF